MFCVCVMNCIQATDCVYVCVDVMDCVNEADYLYVMNILDFIHCIAYCVNSMDYVYFPDNVTDCIYVCVDFMDWLMVLMLWILFTWYMRNALRFCNKSPWSNRLKGLHGLRNLRNKQDLPCQLRRRNILLYLVSCVHLADCVYAMDCVGLSDCVYIADWIAFFEGVQ